MHAISLEEHNALLSEQGWKEEEFEVGFHQDIAASHIQQYAAMVENELAKGEVRGPDDSTGGRGGGVLPTFFVFGTAVFLTVEPRFMTLMVFRQKRCPFAGEVTLTCRSQYRIRIWWAPCFFNTPYLFCA